MNIAVAAFALCGFRIARSQRFAVNTVVVRLLFVGMAGDALRFGQPRIVRNALHRRMAVHAGEHRTVDRSFECVSVNRLAVHHRLIAVTGQAIVVGPEKAIFNCHVARIHWIDAVII